MIQGLRQPLKQELRQSGALLFVTMAALLFTPSLFAQITIEQITPHRFPAALAPSSGNARIVVNYSGNLDSGTTATLIGNTYNAAEFRLSSDTSKTFTVNVYNGDDVPGVELKSFKFRYNNTTYNTFPTSGLPNPGSGSTVTVGIEVIFDSSINSDEYTPSFNIEVTEDP